MTFDNIETYRCTLKNITRKLIQKFKFVTKKNFSRFVQKNQENLFEIIKRLLITYQVMNETSRNMQRHFAITNDDKIQLELRVKIQKQKITNISKKTKRDNSRC